MYWKLENVQNVPTHLRLHLLTTQVLYAFGQILGLGSVFLQLGVKGDCLREPQRLSNFYRDI